MTLVEGLLRFTFLSEIKGTSKNKRAVYLTGIAGIFLLSGFGSALSTLKKKSPKLFMKSSTVNNKYNDTGMELALRALGWGTFYSITTCSILFYGIWKMSGIISVLEFRQKVEKLLPPVSKKNSSL
ncbi:PREDICTED: transmembrane protein 242 [Ceratosolen solmsi marchali]|uniref:Transmembrane protein 242 n=1 Tax=Ceratosolen solmsi marchali TaxID=326594 RepID=A0AAJ7E2U1_9HYME|nr:PREDICTED: transmembrane protein 242 [Ceratosolen solmsi marchali]